MKLEDDFKENNVSSEDDTHLSDETDSPKYKKRKYEDIPSDEIKKKDRNKRKLKKELHKAPTVEELNNLKETENLFNNNLFRLQIQELLSEVSIKNKRKKKLTAWLESLRSILDNLPEYKDVPLSDVKKIKKKKMSKEETFVSGLAEYEQLIKTDQDVILKFIKPESVEQFGLYENNSLTGPNLTLNINLSMPKSCFLLKDFLNNRYFCKRYYYLLYITEHLRSSGIISSALLAFHEGNLLLPILKIQPAKCDKTNVTIYVTPSQDYFKPTRFLPEINNMKQDLFDTNVDVEILKHTPTTLYNSSLCHDITLSTNNDFTKQCLKDQLGVQEGIKLLCIWLQQRELNVGLGAFTENLILYFVVYLIAKKKINKYMSSYQVVRNFWNFISVSDLQTNPISLADTNGVVDLFKGHFDIVCLDKSGCYNVAAFLNDEVYKKIKMESQLAIKLLDDGNNDSFQQLFLRKVPFHLQYDLILDLTESLPLEEKYDITHEDKAKFVGYKDLVIVKYISRTLRRALNKRALNIIPRLEVEDSYSLNKLFFGINLNPDEAFNFIELGPALNDHVGAEQFRQFWGHLSSDRRFRDGSTNVAVHFKTNTIKGKRGIIKKILNFVMDEKLHLKSKLYYDQFEEVLVSKQLAVPYPSGTNEEMSLRVIKASDELGKKLRELEMSLKITGIQGVSDVFSFTELFPPVPDNYKVDESVTTVRENSLIFSTNQPEYIPRYVQPVECVLQLEHSSKWPSDLVALCHIKTSFYLEIAKVLQLNHKIISNATPNYIDILFQGYVFRYRLHVSKEISLVRKAGTETANRESLESIQLEKSLNTMPKVIGALKGLQSQYPSYGPGTALIKRWIRSQLVDDFHFPNIVINLLNASLYLNNNVLKPNTPQSSFLRFLKFFSDFDWNLETVLVNLNDDITIEEVAKLESKLQENRDGYPPLYIIMPFDQGLSAFTKNGPTSEVLYRVKQLAKESLNFIRDVIQEQNHVGIKELFIPNFEGYNVLIHLNPQMNPRKHEQVVFANAQNRIVLDKYQPSDDNKLPITDFNPVAKYLDELRRNYGKFAMFFHDSYGGNTIGVLWKPTVFEVKELKVANLNAGMLVNGKVVFNIDAVIGDFYIVGGNLVKEINRR